MNKKIYIEAREFTPNFEVGNPYRAEVFLRIDDKSIFCGEYSGEIDYIKMGENISQAINDYDEFNRDVIIPGWESELLDKIEEELKLHSPNKIIRENIDWYLDRHSNKRKDGHSY